MSNFNLDEQMIMDSIIQSLEHAAYQVSEDQMAEIADRIEESFPGVIGLIAQTVAEDWRAEARGSGGWGTKYANAVSYRINNDGSGEVFLDEELIDKSVGKPFFMFAMMMEKGVSSWSIKKALLASEKAKIGPDGVKYIIVPMPIRTPKKNKGTSSAKQFGKREMSNEIYNIVKSKGRLKSGKLKTGEDVSGLSKYITRQRHEAYAIFRRVSAKTQGWQYPDIPAEPVFSSVLDGVNKTINEAIALFCSNIVKEYTT